ncbi:MAG: hypothetical protein HY787_30090 [Deltaproteobacteria bacterium]|nr:hypothetical protein [Deltaproteobacteria bacterium]
MEFGFGYNRAQNAWDKDGKSQPRGLREGQTVGLTRSNFPPDQAFNKKDASAAVKYAEKILSLVKEYMG